MEKIQKEHKPQVLMPITQDEKCLEEFLVRAAREPNWAGIRSVADSVYISELTVLRLLNLALTDPMGIGKESTFDKLGRNMRLGLGLFIMDYKNYLTIFLNDESNKLETLYILYLANKFTTSKNFLTRIASEILCQTNEFNVLRYIASDLGYENIESILFERLPKDPAELHYMHKNLLELFDIMNWNQNFDDFRLSKVNYEVMIHFHSIMKGWKESANISSRTN